MTLRDHLAYDGLWDAFTDQAMGRLTEACNTGAEEVSRADSDAFAARSHQRRRQRPSCSPRRSSRSRCRSGAATRSR